MRELKIDPELRDLLPPLTSEEYKQLEKNIVENGFDRNFPIMEWQGFIVDGHNRYDICKKHNIEPIIGTLAYKTKEEVMEWMLDIQLGRRNLTPIQKIAITEKYRPIYEKQAKEKQSDAGKNYGNGTEKLPPKLGEAKKSKENETNTKLSKLAGVGKETYRMGAKILNSDNEKLKQEVLSGEKSINAGYKELTGKKENKKEEIKNTASQSNMDNKKEKRVVENGVILLPENSEENKMANDICRRMKSGDADWDKINNDMELNNIKQIVNDNIDISISYIRSNLNFDNFNSSNLERLREIINEANEKMNILMKDMEELVNE
nr:MAG TPA: putative CHROMOSOME PARTITIONING PROTEIN PARB [Caudoviricetes sp.]